MKQIYKIEMKRAFTGKRMVAALGIGLAISISHLVLWMPDMLNMAKYNDMDTSGLYYPLTVFYGWIGGLMIPWQQYLYFLIIPLLASLPFGTSLFDDKKHGYLKNLAVKCGKKDYYRGKLMAVFLSGGCAAVIPLIFNLLVVMMFLPSMVPEAATHIYSVGSRTLFAGVFYSHPFIYLLLYFIIQFIFAGLFAGISLVVSDMTEYRFIVEVAPLIIYVFFCSVMDLIGKTGWAPNMFLNPSYNQMNTAIIIAEAVILAIGVIGYVGWKGKRDEIF